MLLSCAIAAVSSFLAEGVKAASSSAPDSGEDRAPVASSGWFPRILRRSTNRICAESSPPAGRVVSEASSVVPEDRHSEPAAPQAFPPDAVIPFQEVPTESDGTVIYLISLPFLIISFSISKFIISMS